MLTKDILLGMNLLTLAGFVLIGIALIFTRRRAMRGPVAFALMTLGTVLVVIGMYVSPPAGS